MLASTFSFLLLAISKCLAYDSQWVPSFYLGNYPERFQTLRMYRGSCVMSFNTYKSKHYNVEIPLINGSLPAGFCAILLTSMENSSLAIAIEQGLTDVNNNLLNQNIKLFKVKYGNVKLIHDCGSNDVPGLTLAESNTAILLIKADQNINFSLSVYTYQSFITKT
ncbi:uncharacterized protein LOC112687116 isoform X2 [Sipha flava]|uniref:Uncharacterized protein LOC112687116 isoform X2 n=1 Tax=Sipha flava TaxID=143950 RepID=A0A8B8FYN1_9HEMI|nr:uncharacterized protein LOC112687116 isoform X2 [Sipha flava]